MLPNRDNRLWKICTSGLLFNNVSATEVHRHYSVSINHLIGAPKNTQHTYTQYPDEISVRASLRDSRSRFCKQLVITIKYFYLTIPFLGNLENVIPNTNFSTLLTYFIIFITNNKESSKFCWPLGLTALQIKIVASFGMI